jgi:hypothetical protein
MTTQEITNSEDVLDSRDIRARIDDLSSQDADDLDEAERAELAALTAFQKEAEDYASDWQHGAALIRDSYFTDYAKELLEDIGDVPHDLPGYLVIDWEQTAANIQQDYAAIDFDGVTYWVR